MRKRYSPQFKAQVCLEVLREEKSLVQVASEHEVHPAMVKRWKRQAEEGLPSILDDARRHSQKEVDQEKLLGQLYTKIGKMTTELEWLQRKAGVFPEAHRA